MDLTDQEAAEIAAECIAALKWLASFPKGIAVPTKELAVAVGPRRPATLQIIAAMRRGDANHHAMYDLLPHSEPGLGIALFPETCRSIARNLADWGFQREAHPADELKREPLAGGIFAFEPGVKGLPEAHFTG